MRAASFSNADRAARRSSEKTYFEPTSYFRRMCTAFSFAVVLWPNYPVICYWALTIGLLVTITPSHILNLIGSGQYMENREKYIISHKQKSAYEIVKVGSSDAYGSYEVFVLQALHCCHISSILRMKPHLSHHAQVPRGRLTRTIRCLSGATVRISHVPSPAR